MKEHYRNGDWTILEVNDEYISSIKKLEKVESKKEQVFAEGEATNHFHIATVKDKRDMEFSRMPDGSFLVILKDEATITHPQHSIKVDLKVPPGKYVFYKRREKDWFQLTTRKVID